MFKSSFLKELRTPKLIFIEKFWPDACTDKNQKGIQSPIIDWTHRKSSSIEN
jgi:hypothetical protein